MTYYHRDNGRHGVFCPLITDPVPSLLGTWIAMVGGLTAALKGSAVDCQYWTQAAFGPRSGRAAGGCFPFSGRDDTRSAGDGTGPERLARR